MRCRSLPFARGLETEPARLRWPVECDVDAFRRAVEKGSWAEATDLYGGELFAGATFEDAGEFSTWLEMERAGLEESYRLAVFRRAESLSETGELQEAVGVAEGLLRHDPLDEEAVQLVMRLLDESGKPELSLRHYRNFRKVLAQQFDLEPSTATEKLEQAIRKHSEESLQQSVPERVVADGLERPLAPSAREGSTGSGTDVHPALAPLNTFVGRDPELAELRHLLSQDSCRLVTLTGPGGVGKTRLALKALEEFRGGYSDGAHFVSVESASSAAAVSLTIAAALKVVLHGTDDPLEQVARSIGNGRVLLVLDNYEQLLESATMLASLLAACPHLDLLVTSRERLGLAEEWLLPLDGFAYPRADVPAETAEAYDAVRFFLERARQVRPEFELTEVQLPHVLEICRLVEGLPLGLELAAVWVRIMPPSEIAQEVRRSVDFLTSGNRNVPDRHRSIQAAFEHSWSFLSEREKQVMRKLAVFRGGFRRDAAAFVAGATIPILAALLDKSLLRVSPQGRYDRHPLLYEFTSRKLAERPQEEREAKDRHAHYFASLSEEAGKNDATPQQEAWLVRIEAEYDNFRAALDWIESSAQAELGMRLIGSLNWFWGWRGIVDEPRAWQRRVLAIPGAERTSSRARLLTGAGLKAALQGEFALGRELAEEALTIAREVGDRKTEILALNELSDIAFRSGDVETSERLARSGLALARELGDEVMISECLAETGALFTSVGRYREAQEFMEASIVLSKELGDQIGIGARTMFLGTIASGMGDVERGRALLHESLDVARERSHAFIRAYSLLGLGILACDDRDFGQARACLRECLEVWWEAGMTWRVGSALEAIAALEAADGAPVVAAQVCGAAESLRETLSAWMAPPDREAHERAVAQARCRVDEEVFQSAWQRGRALDARRAVEFAADRLSDA